MTSGLRTACRSLPPWISSSTARSSSSPADPTGSARAAAARLVAEGARVANCGRNEARLEAATSELRAMGVSSGGDVLAVRADVAHPTDLERFVSAAADAWQQIDGLVNNAGRSSAMSFDSLRDEYLEDDLELKVFASVRMIRLALSLLRRSTAPSVVNVLSIGAKAPTPRSTPTTISPCRRAALPKVLAGELGPDGIPVNAICVGLVESGQWVRLSERLGIPVPEVQASLLREAGAPISRIGRSDEFGDLAAYLLSARSLVRHPHRHQPRRRHEPRRVTLENSPHRRAD